MVAVDAVFLIVVITGNRIIEVDIANDIHRKREAVELVVVTFIDQHIHDDRLAVSTEIRYRSLPWANSRRINCPYSTT